MTVRSENVQFGGGTGYPYAVSVAIVERLELHNVRMANNPHDLKLTILRMVSQVPTRQRRTNMYLESLVLENTLDSSVFPRGRELRLEDHAKRSVAHDLALRVLYFSLLTCNSILYLLTDDLSHPQGVKGCGAIRRHL